MFFDDIGSIIEAVAYIGLSASTCIPAQAYILRKHLDVHIAGTMTMGLLPGTAIGTVVLIYVTSPWIKRSLGLLFLVVWVVIQRKASTDNSQPTTVAADDDGEEEAFRLESKASYLLLWVTSVFAGILGGLFGTAGPPFMVYLQYHNMNKDTWRSCAATAGSIYSPIRTVMVFYFGGVWDNSKIPVYVCVMLGSIAGLVFGNECVADKIDKVMFRKLINVLLFLGSVLLISSGFALVSKIIGITSVCIFFMVCISYLARKKFCNNTKKPGNEVELSATV